MKANYLQTPIRQSVDAMNSSLNYVPVDQQLLTNARCERA
jgi:hypothetical protein